MILIDVKTLELKEFIGNQVPPYAILSHTWHEEEVSFQDWSDRPLAARKKGYRKIFDTCRQAKKHNHQYLWVDTNCIDKSSSAELTEAINSMFKWYRSAQVCYVYLSDVPSSDAKDFHTRFRNSRWFKRGWTLQELLAPRDVEFYSSDWSFLGTKESLCSSISSITGINVQWLQSKSTGNIKYVAPLRNASVSERLSWLSSRETTRLEDMAYCMLGIFDLNMPLLYGEGSKAFIRLQQEIMKVSDDHSLFCWTWKTAQNQGGFLSEVPADFRLANRFVPKQGNQRPSPYTFTNAGLDIRLPILHGWGSTFICILRVESVETGEKVGLPMSGDLATGRVYRESFPAEPIPLCGGTLGSKENRLFVSESYIQNHPSSPTQEVPAQPTKDPAQFDVLLTFGSKGMVRRIKTYPPDRFDPTSSSVKIFSPEVLGAWQKVPNWKTRLGPNIRFVDPDHTYEGVMVQLELPTRESKCFMVAAILEDEKTARWKSHCWQVPPEDAAVILSGSMEEVSEEANRAHSAIQNPHYATTLDIYAENAQMGVPVSPVSSRPQSQPVQLSISISKGYLVVNNRAIAHMHLAL